MVDSFLDDDFDDPELKFQKKFCEFVVPQEGETNHRRLVRLSQELSVKDKEEHDTKEDAIAPPLATSLAATCLQPSDSPNQNLQIFQKNPAWSKASTYKLKSWTETVEGYLYEAKKLTTCLFQNRKLAKEPYTWFLTIYVDVVMPPKAINEWWKKAARNLQRNGIIAIWVREPTRTNKVHYHLLLRSKHTRRQLTTIIEESLPSRKLGRWHKNLKLIEGSDWRLLNYITKAKTPGRTKSGKQVQDLYRRKRLLFHQGLCIRKHGTIGPFWLKSKEAIWTDIKFREQKIAEGLAKRNVRRLAEHVHEVVQGAIPLQEIERKFGFNWDSPMVQNWIAQVFRSETASTAS